MNCWSCASCRRKAEEGCSWMVSAFTAEVPVLALEDPASGAMARIAEEIEHAKAEDRAEVIVLGCAGMADLAARLSSAHAIPVVDGVAAAVKLAEALASLGLRTSKIGAYAAPLPKVYMGLFAEVGRALG